ncbi:substrate-binding periplasmic protein [Aliikangiella coralliicola]|uniref:Transporter substrate-binding domain-containing protein n=1 Tax=Aliikangiella coralliicola TaxID=2592383 RepID=A0A545UE44_9GAMM|nr:transporter substrate-binding domain-containing protein [Aliikangiella coralliicola]TQV87731.1 transporter substrate-binding domain-containing protein [Aliikangiella coralliicola]
MKVDNTTIQLFFWLTLSFSNNLSAEKCETFIYSGAVDWYPISYSDESGRLSGIALTRIKKIAEGENIKLKVIKGLPWRRQLELLEKGEISLVAGYYNRERDSQFLLSQPFFREQVKVFFRQDSKREISKIDQLKSLLGVRPRAASLGDEFDIFSKNNTRLFQLGKTINMFKMLLAGRVDYVVTAYANGMRAVRLLNAERKVVAADYLVAENNVHFMFSRKLDCEVDIQAFNRLIEIHRQTDFEKAGR